MYRNCIILSGARPGMSEWELADNWASLGLELQGKGYDIVTVEGSYEGVEESSWLVKGVTLETKTKRVFIDLLKKYNQDSMLYISSLGMGYIIEAKGSSYKIGPLTLIGERDLDKYLGWSKIQGKYYTCIEE